MLSSHRHAIVLNLFEQIAKVRHRTGIDYREKIDNFIINTLGGSLTITVMLFLMFYSSFWLGDIISRMIDQPLDNLGFIIKGLTGGGLVAVAISGFYDGFLAGIGIVIPYLTSLLILLAIIEDTGLLPRMAFRVDSILRKFGLHRTAMIPITGYWL